MRSDDRLVLTCFAIVLGVGVAAVCLITFGSVGVIGWAGTVFQKTAQVYQTEAWSTYAVEVTEIAATEQVYEKEYENALFLLEDAKDWEIVINDDFGDNVNEWRDGPIAFQRLQGDVRITDGEYKWELEAKRGFVYYEYPAMDAVNDFYVEVEAESIDGPIYGAYGLIFRYASSTYYYYFAITDDQRYEVYLLRANSWEDIIPPTYSEAINPEQANKLAIIVIQEDLYFFINDTFVNYVDSSVLIRGKVGLLTGLSLEGDTSEFIFDNFEVRVPPGGGQ